MLIRIIILSAAILSATPADAQRADGRCSTTARPAETGATPVAMSEWRGVREAVVDSIDADVEAAARQAGIQQPAGMVVMVIQDRATGRAEIRLHGANVPERLVRDALARRAPLLASLPADDNLLYFRLDPVLVPGGIASVVECTPQITNREWFYQELRQVIQEEGSGMTGTAHLKMLVTREGRVAYANVPRSGRPALDQALVRVTRGLRFEPATVEGVPVDVWVEAPIPLTRP
ncbi:MAG TPA: energy transducer TonB [Longimicrobium sp.]|nr:energy transducer TonB [Longimicrobium sp.]